MPSAHVLRSLLWLASRVSNHGPKPRYERRLLVVAASLRLMLTCYHDLNRHSGTMAGGKSQFESTLPDKKYSRLRRREETGGSTLPGGRLNSWMWAESGSKRCLRLLLIRCLRVGGHDELRISQVEARCEVHSRPPVLRASGNACQLAK